MYWNKDEQIEKYILMERETGEVHKCQERIDSCGNSGYSSTITTTTPNTNSTSKYNPTAYYDTHATFCKYCNQRIKFDAAVKSPSNKFIPLSYDTGSKHFCTENPYFKNKQRYGSGGGSSGSGSSGGSNNSSGSGSGSESGSNRR